MLVVEDEDESDTVRAVPDMGPVKTTAQSQMDAAVVALARELSKLRTGRASAGIIYVDWIALHCFKDVVL